MIIDVDVDSLVIFVKFSVGVGSGDENMFLYCIVVCM